MFSLQFFFFDGVDNFTIGHYLRNTLIWGCPRGVMVKVVDCGIVVRKFALQLRYYIHFRTNTLRKDMNLLILPAIG